MNLPITEQENPQTTTLDTLNTLELTQLMNQLDAAVPVAVGTVLPEIAKTIDLAAATLTIGGRLFYQGAGTSGRLAVLDAVELLPTFSLEPGRVIALLAGGAEALTHSVEGAEDDELQGQRDLEAHAFSGRDMLIGLAASGRTPYVLGGLRHAQAVGGTTVAVVCAEGSPLAALAHITIAPIIGPELIAGSTRLRAGTAQKLVLNMISTGAMVKLGKVYGNRMIDVRPTNQKLRQRAIRIVSECAEISPETAQGLLEQAGWQVKVAVVMGRTGADPTQAAQRLAACRGHVREVMVAGDAPVR